MTILAVFRSRAQSLEFIATLKNAGVPVQAVNTPKEAGTGCGISAKFDERFLPRARYILTQKRYSSYSGMMKQTGNGFLYLKT